MAGDRIVEEIGVTSAVGFAPCPLIPVAHALKEIPRLFLYFRDHINSLGRT